MKTNNKKRILSKIGSVLTIVFLGFSLVSVFPFSVFAIVPTDTTTTTANTGYCSKFSSTLIAGSNGLSDVMKFVTCLIENSVIPLIFAIATVSFVWGVVKFIQSESAVEREEGQQFMLWGVIGLAVMFSIWGLVKIFGDTFHIGNVIPQLPITPK